MKKRTEKIWRGSRVFLLFIVFCCTCFLDCAAIWAAGEETPEELKNLYARGAVLMDGDSGRVLFGKNEEEVLPMASTTKIMTCILALELADPGEVCQVSETAAAQPKVHLGMHSGETYYLGDLLYSMMLESHNDSAVCVAEHVGGSVEGFARLMNQKAAEIGCRQAHYITPNGLDGEDEEGAHSITASDLALVMRYCIMVSEKREEFLEITRTAQYSFQDLSGTRNFSCVNHNALLTMMDGALSGKTGFTGNAGYCYVGAVRREEKTLIVALLACGWPNNKGYKWSDTRKLMDYGFSHYERKTFDLSRLELPAVQVLHGVEDQVQIGLADTLTNRNGAGKPAAVDTKITLLLSREEVLKVRIQTAETVEAPVAAGETAGKASCMLGEEIVAEFPLIYQENVNKINYFFCLEQVMSEYLF